MWCLVLGRRGGGGSAVRESLGAFVTWHFSTPGLSTGGGGGGEDGDGGGGG